MIDLLSLTKNERKLYEILSSFPVATVTQIQQDVYGWPEGLASKVDYTNVRMAISRLKKKGVHIETVRGVGFRLVTQKG